jgi:hypothetical protein
MENKKSLRTSMVRNEISQIHHQTAMLYAEMYSPTEVKQK